MVSYPPLNSFRPRRHLIYTAVMDTGIKQNHIGSGDTLLREAEGLELLTDGLAGASVTEVRVLRVLVVSEQALEMTAIAAVTPLDGHMGALGQDLATLQRHQPAGWWHFSIATATNYRCCAEISGPAICCLTGAMIRSTPASMPATIFTIAEPLQSARKLVPGGCREWLRAQAPSVPPGPARHSS